MDLEAAARRLGVHYQTAYRWVRSGVLPAVKVGAEYEIDPADVERLVEQQRLGRAAPANGNPDWDAASAELYEGVRSGDEIGAQCLVDRLFAGGLAPLHLCELLIAPILTRLGEDHQSGAASPADIALAAGICERLVGSLATPSRGRPRGLAVVASPEGEHHRIPSLMATAALRGDRWRVHHLGADVPPSDLLSFIRATGPDVVVMSVMVAVETAIATRDRLNAECAIPVLVGEPGARLARLLRNVAGGTTHG